MQDFKQIEIYGKIMELENHHQAIFHFDYMLLQNPAYDTWSCPLHHQSPSYWEDLDRA